MGAAKDRLDVIELIHRYAALIDLKTYDDQGKSQEAGTAVTRLITSWRDGLAASRFGPTVPVLAALSSV